MPDWFKMVNRDRFATSDGMSAARIPSSALVRFCTWLLMTLTADCRRLMPAPIAPRMLATLAIALSMWPSAVWEFVPSVPVRVSAEMFTAFAPLLAFCADCVRAVVFAVKPSAIARPAASSAPELIREPEERRNKVFCKFWLVIDKLFCATNEGMLFRMLSAILLAPYVGF